ncbi:unnamed protein product [Adineta steineri]|uniref:Uncharacterized protein n=1 Tax=Adineta steineri TaxID=433720 RepID=A0A818TG00_9BILA|nr:unnamed protein product [Adineta steineri]CAF3682699.1 unnamed protein product [Adineta steineri]
MSYATKRVSVVRIPRQVLNQVNPERTDKSITTSYLIPPDIQRHERTSSNNLEQIYTSTSKTDLFTTTVPKTSDVRIDDVDRQNSDMQSVKSTVTVQQQPTRIDTWIKPSTENQSRPHLNWKGTNKWTFGLCSCCDDFNMFCYACSCWCCFRHELTSMMNEHWLLWFLNCSPLMELRTKFRQQYAIQGSIGEDFCLSTCCPLCVALQLANESRQYGHRIFT